MHPYLTQEKLLRYCRESSIAVTAFSPLGAPSYVPLGMATEGENAMDETIVQDIARNYDKSPAQVLLRWGVQRGTSVIPKTSKPERLVENLDVFDFELSEFEMTAISALNRNRRFNDPGVFCEAAFGTYFPIYE
jgi:D-xylose reductase